MRERAMAQELECMEPTAVWLPWAHDLGDDNRHSFGYDRADGYG